MKPTVIPSGNNNENNTQGVNMPARNTHHHDPNNNPTTGQHNTSSNQNSELPYFQQQDFGFDPNIDDIFSDTGLRSRLPNRMRDAFSSFGARKRFGNDKFTDPYSHYFEDDADDFFPAFGQMGRTGRRARPNPQATNNNASNTDDGFFTNFPDEFRQYIPEGFGFPSQRRGNAGATSGSPQSTRGHLAQEQQHPLYQQQQPQQQHPQYQQHPQQHPQYQQQPQQQHPQYQQQPQQQHPQYQMPQYQPHHQQYPPQSPQYQSGGGIPYYDAPVPQSPKPQLCDAAMQTEDLAAESTDVFPSGNSPKLRQHGFRNTMDMGQKSAQEEQNRGPRSQSAPPHNQDEQNPNEQPIYVSSATFKTSAPRKTPLQMRTQASQKQNFGSPPPLSPLRKPPVPFQRDQPPTPTTPGGSYIRTVPMFVEGRKDPVINSHKQIPNQYVQQQQQQAAQQTPPQWTRPTVNTQQANQPDDAGLIDTEQPIPQTPHTTDCINKITEIQRDVLELMTKVENFTGKKNDKDYMYLDEMLTRNLLKLDTIDTNGKESIRLARREAIKCIQASINVLEAKSGENARYTDVNIKALSLETASPVENQESSKPKPGENPNDISANLADENQNILNENIVIPLPPPPPHESDNTNRNEDNPNMLDEKMIIALPPPPESKNDEMNITSESTSNVAVKIPNSNSEIATDDINDTQSVADIVRARSTSKSPTKDGTKKKIIKKVKKLVKKNSKDIDEDELAAAGATEIPKKQE